MITLLADANILWHVELLMARMQIEPWRGFWDYLQLRCLTFQDVGLDRADSDAIIWQCCQEKELLLLTDNRNDDRPDSLESTIRLRNTPQSLPVFTIGNSRAILSGHEYSDRVIDRLFQYLLTLDEIRGTGRLYLP